MSGLWPLVVLWASTAGIVAGLWLFVWVLVRAWENGGE